MAEESPLEAKELLTTSGAAIEELPPPLDVRWMRPKSSSAILELPTAPITMSNSPKDTLWQAFSVEESIGCEAAWQELSEEERRHSEDDDETDVSKQHEEDEDDDDETVGVSIAKDKLFEVDVRSEPLHLPLLFLNNITC